MTKSLSRSIYLGIGSNLNRKQNIINSVRELKLYFPDLQLSPVYETEAYGFNGNDFYNLVAGFKSEIKLDELIQILKNIEDANGRIRNAKKFSDRSIDIDILLFGDEVLYPQRLDIPRKEIAKYPFVLKPLADLAPGTLHPVIGKTISRLWQEFPDKQNSLKPLSRDEFNLEIV